MTALAESVIAEGIVYFDQIIAGINQGLVRMPGPGKLSTKPNSDLIEAVTKEKGKYGQVVASAAIAKPSDLSLMFSAISPAALALALQGSLANYSQGSGTVTDQAATAKLGKYLELGFGNLAAASVTVTNDGATVTYVEGTDYEVNYALGLVYISPTGAITESQALKIDYTHNAIAGSRVTMATTPQVRTRILMDGRNLFDGIPLQIEIFEAILTADGDVDWFSEKPIELSFKGRMLVPAGKPGPMEVKYGLTFS